MAWWREISPSNAIASETTQFVAATPWLGGKLSNLAKLMARVMSRCRNGVSGLPKNV